jgi:hypothetical protein
VIDHVQAVTAGVNALLPRVAALGTPATEAAELALLTAEECARSTLLARPSEPSHQEVEYWTSETETRRANSAAVWKHIIDLNDQIGRLKLEEAARSRSVWRRWFPDRKAIEEIAKLETARQKLRAEYGREEAPFLKAFASQSRAEKAYKMAVAESRFAHEQGRKAAQTIISSIQRARRVLSLWPSYAFCGSKVVYSAGVRIQAAKESGWDEPSLEQRASIRR